MRRQQPRNTKKRDRKVLLFSLLVCLVLIHQWLLYQTVSGTTSTSTGASNSISPQQTSSNAMTSVLEQQRLRFSSSYHNNATTGNSKAQQSLSSTRSNLLRLAHEARYSILEPPHHTVFFNIFLNNQTGVKTLKSLKIVHDQLRDFPNGTNVYYNVIGSSFLFRGGDHQTPHVDICESHPHLGSCTFLKYYPKAMEEVTLQALYDYCHQQQSSSDSASPHTHQVTYIHNKGSFRDSASNSWNRQRATWGAVSTACLMNRPPTKTRDNTQHTKKCNICGTKFQYRPYFHYTANMWTAKCSLVTQLIPPLEYHAKRLALLQRLWNEHECLGKPADPKMIPTTFEWDLTNTTFLRNVGLGRYAMERWILNHPTTIPCEVWSGPLMSIRPPSDENHSPFILGQPSDWGRMVSWKVKSRENWLLQQEYKELYPQAKINSILLRDQRRPKPKPCWP